MNNFLQKATDPNQYDNLEWSNDGSLTAPTRTFFQRIFQREIIDVEDKSIIDIGSGAGHLYPLLTSLKAGKVIGLEPSAKNIKLSRKTFPDFIVTQSTLEGFESEQQFDIAIASLVFEHIENTEEALEKVYSLLNPSGLFYLLVMDVQHAITPRHNYDIEVEDLEHGSYSVKTDRASGVMYDLVRPPSHFIEIGEKIGFKIEKSIQQKPDKELLEESPKYKEFADISLVHLLVFKK